MPNAASPDASAAAEGLAAIGSAAASGAACTLSLEGAGAGVTRRGRMSAAPAGEVRLIISGNHADAEAASSQWLADGVAATVCVRTGEQDLVFFSRVTSVAPTPDESSDELEVRLTAPTQVISTRRRSTYRVAVTEGDAIALRLWRIDPYAILRDQPPPSRSLRCCLCDLSIKGMRAIVWAGRVEALGLVQGLRFRVELKSGDVEMIFEAKLRHPRATARDDEFAVCGFEFVHDDDDIDSRRNRQKLDAVVAKLQRTAAQRDAA